MLNALDVERKLSSAIEAAAVTACQDTLLALALKPRGTFRALVPRQGGRLRSDLVYVGSLFFQCVVADVQSAKAELGSVWKARRVRAACALVVLRTSSLAHIASALAEPRVALLRRIAQSSLALITKAGEPVAPQEDAEQQLDAELKSKLESYAARVDGAGA